MGKHLKRWELNPTNLEDQETLILNKIDMGHVGK